MTPLRMLVPATLCAQAQLIKKVLRPTRTRLLQHFDGDVVSDPGQPRATGRGRREPHVAVGAMHCAAGIRASEDEAARVTEHPEVLTHVTNTDQRLLELTFHVVNDDELEVQGPLKVAHMPRGYGLLFVLDHDCTPSVGKFVKVI